MTDPRKPFFDAARAADEDGVLVLDDIKKIHAVLDLAGIPRAPLPPAPSPAPGGCSKIGADGINLIMQFEGCHRIRKDGLVEAYPDPGSGGDPWTIGWGATGTGLHGTVRRGTVWTQQQCDERLRADLTRYADDVSRAIGNAPTTQAQFDALVSFHYNTGAIGRATLTRKHIAGDYAGAAREFARWNRAAGRVLPGLTRRRASEAKLYRGEV